MKKRFILLMTGILMCWGNITAAEDAHEKTITMEEVVVSVTRTNTTMEKIGGSTVTVITEEDIKAKNINSVSELLKTVPGLDVVSNGGVGTTTSVFLRGADSKNTLVLIDGIMFNNPSQANRGANLANLTTDNIERIEVVRGPMSVLYGSNATAGVINIITKSGKTAPSLYAGAEGGSFSTWKGYGGASGAAGRFDYSLSASHLKSDGFSIADDDNNDIPHAGNTDEEDEYKNTTLSGKFGLDITDNFSITTVARYMDSEADLDDYVSGYTGDNIGSTWMEVPPGSGNWIQTAIPFPDGPNKRRIESDQFLGKISLNSSFYNDFIESSLSYQMSHQENQSYHNSGEKSYDYKGRTDDVTWQGNLNFDSNTLSLGATYFNEEMKSSSSDVSRVDVDTISGWIQDQLSVGRSLVIVAGMRFDDHDKFGSKTTWRLAPSYLISQTGTRLKASYGTGFRSPSLYELYSNYGNPDLKAEKSKGWDVGFEQKLANEKISFGATWFYMIYDDRIDYDWAISRYNQIPGETKTDGIETFIGWQPSEDLSFLISYSYNDTEEPDGERLERRPLNKALFNTRYQFHEKGSVDLDIHWVDKRKASQSARDAGGNSVKELDAYSLVNLSAAYDITKNVQVYGRIENLFDEYYEEAWSYATPGISAYMGIKVDIGKNMFKRDS